MKKYEDSKKSLEKRMAPIFNPGGPDMDKTEDLIKIHTDHILNHPRVYSGVKEHAIEMIEALREGYEIQSGKKYTGFYPEKEIKEFNKSR
jgi:hypothetical protein